MRPADVLGAVVLGQLGELGLAIKQARKRRKMNRARFAASLLVSEMTLRRVESGDPSVAMGTYVAALAIINEKSLSDLVRAVQNEPEAISQNLGR